jgi:hypothetical protein
MKTEKAEKDNDSKKVSTDINSSINNNKLSLEIFINNISKYLVDLNANF